MGCACREFKLYFTVVVGLGVKIVRGCSLDGIHFGCRPLSVSQNSAFNVEKNYNIILIS